MIDDRYYKEKVVFYNGNVIEVINIFKVSEIMMYDLINVDVIGIDEV